MVNCKLRKREEKTINKLIPNESILNLKGRSHLDTVLTNQRNNKNQLQTIILIHKHKIKKKATNYRPL